ncbi:MAG: ACP S-malonyltransferase [Bacteroidales bacterium]|nr:ACP S-malonyltransferase [Bacteroidales bacterium]MDD2203908.1 ACP S-malonyltransferase [Bacteroidales bacterium]MDD3151469.1 ACP S-malonyltransferase [Bacteroidales bacterium]MDD3913077.1 ACP S-malonyltransferase [Bacteroidales bacterium]MDD4632992.1 ACP S-malonyltransferase [Bacteroidales bacterium]
MKAYIFPGQGAQFSGMGKDLYDSNSIARDLFKKANSILGFKITDIMFEGAEDDLKQTKVTQPAIFLHSVILSVVKKDDFTPDMVAGHSLGEFSALTAIGALSFEDGLKLVSKRAMCMQEACELEPSTMAAVLKMDVEPLESILNSINDEIVVAANYNCPGQIVISGTVQGVEKATELITAANGRVVPLKVGGAFHSPLMAPAKEELATAIQKVNIVEPQCPIFQNVNAQPVKNPDVIKKNLISQLTSPVRWMQSMQNMIADGATCFYEVGPGTVLQGLLRKIKHDINVESL